MIGVHSPEFGFEKKRASLEAEVKRHDLRYPQYLDNDHAYWRALEARYWPTTYLVDKCGLLRHVHIGEIHADQDSGKQVEAAIEALLAEPASCPEGSAARE
ncbi:MAG TPA: hypothetical protein VFM88_12450 [Vicinamibacteria bacterium]|nr:hypothetical protein [Vicinamibacteria bacterium]